MILTSESSPRKYGLDNKCLKNEPIMAVNIFSGALEL